MKVSPRRGSALTAALGAIPAAARAAALAASLAAALAASLAGCASPARRADDFAYRSGFHKEILLGKDFHHVVYRNAAAAAGTTLHVYIEGDGSPYLDRHTVSADPTPHLTLMLRLMALDRAPSIYVGRPCYFAQDRDAGCGPLMWTLRRYAPEVVESMEYIVRAESVRTRAATLEIYGHSGGGDLAVLLAQRLRNVTRVVTIGANLDIAAWCTLHGYSPLAGSINPANTAQGRTDLSVLHLVGARDANTPPSLVEAAARARGGETVRIVADYDHRCCWQSLWPGILREPAGT